MAEENYMLPENIFLVMADQLIPIRKTMTKMGRHPDNDLIVADSLVSRWHAHLLYVNNRFMVQDLDSKNGNAIMELLRRSRDELEQTVIVVSHDPKATAYADRVIFLRDGDIVDEYKPDASTPLSDKLRGIMGIMEQLEA